MADTQIPAKCPECGQLTVDNRYHCEEKTKRHGMTWWAKNCLTMSCRCGVTYAAHGHHPKKAATS